MKFRHVALALLVAASTQAHADTIGLWDFNTFSCASACASNPPKGQTANGGSLSAVGGVTFTSAQGVPTSSNALNTSTYGTATGANLSRGVQFLIDTTGYTDVSLSFLQRNSSSASAYTTLQYTVNGTDWLFATSFLMPAASVTTFVSTPGYDFSSIAEVNDNPNFGIRLLASYAPNTSSFVGTSAAFANTGTIRYDNVTFSGTALPDVVEPPAVPEPQTYALMLGGLAAIGLLARRRRSA